MHKFQEQHGRDYHKYISGLETEEKAGKENVRKDLLEKMKAERANVLETYGSGFHGSGFGGSGFGGSGLGGSGHGNHTSNGHIMDHSVHYTFNFSESAFPNVQQLSLPTSSARGSEDLGHLIGRISALPLPTPLPVSHIQDRDPFAIFSPQNFGSLLQIPDRLSQGSDGSVSPSASVSNAGSRVASVASQQASLRTSDVRSQSQTSGNERCDMVRANKAIEAALAKLSE